MTSLSIDAGFDKDRWFLATGGKTEDEKPAKTPKAPKPTQSHIHQARNFNQPKKLPDKGPMAEMLKKMFGPKGD